MKTVIYTAIFGSYDTLKDQPVYPGVEYVCFTDDPKIKSDCWTIKQVLPPPNEHPRITAKRFKTVPHIYLSPSIEFSIWIDGSMVLTNPDFVKMCTACVNPFSSKCQRGLAAMNHPVGNCIYQESQGCFEMEKYKGLPILEQADHYKKEGYPENNGLAACGVIVRNMLHPKIRKINEDWLAENLRWTYQDQISFPYVLWKNDWWYDALPFSCWDGIAFNLHDHNRID